MKIVDSSVFVKEICEKYSNLKEEEVKTIIRIFSNTLLKMLKCYHSVLIGSRRYRYMIYFLSTDYFEAGKEGFNRIYKKTRYFKKVKSKLLLYEQRAANNKFISRRT
jgi:hypothetical protein